MKPMDSLKLTALALAAAAVAALAAPALADIKIGSTLAQTGPASFLGDPEAKTLQMLVAERNANGGVNGEQIELIMYDDGADPNKARSSWIRAVCGSGSCCRLIHSGRPTARQKACQNFSSSAPSTTNLSSAVR